MFLFIIRVRQATPFLKIAFIANFRGQLSTGQVIPGVVFVRLSLYAHDLRSRSQLIRFIDKRQYENRLQLEAFRGQVNINRIDKT